MILVLGAGVSGSAIVRFLGRRGVSARVYDRSVHGAVEGLPVISGDWVDDLLVDVTLVVASPGFPEHGEPITAALRAGIPVWSEIELASTVLDVPMAAVTGTNGKTTVTTLIDDMLRASGLRSAAVGNIGTALCDAEDLDVDVLVVEASSFQLRFIDRFHAEVAVLLDIADDHLDWHGTFARYAAAKARVTEHQGPQDTLVYAADDPEASLVAASSRATTIPASGRRVPDGGVGFSPAGLEVGEFVIPAAVIPPVDDAYGLDLAAAAAAAVALGATEDGIRTVVAAFHPGRHRREIVGEVDGVTYVNDSKATNPHAAASAIRAFPSVVAILGGRNKGLDLAPLLAEPTLRAAVGIGEASGELAAVDPSLPVASTMVEAVVRARALAQPGDVVLLAPGCASFDMFASYVDRGDAFIEAVRGMMQDDA